MLKLRAYCLRITFIESYTFYGIMSFASRPTTCEKNLKALLENAYAMKPLKCNRMGGTNSLIFSGKNNIFIVEPDEKILAL